MNFILPNLLSCFQCNSILIKEFDTLKLNSVKGVIPFHIFNGELNENKNKQFYTINSIQDAIINYNILNTYDFYFYFNNDLLQTIDFDDIFTINLLKLFQQQINCNIFLLVSNLNFIKLLEEKYDGIKYYLCINKTSDLNKINLIQDNKNFQGIELDLSITFDWNKKYNFDILGKLPLFNCNTCTMLNQCYLKEQMNILDFSEISNITDCSIKTFTTLETITTYYSLFKNRVSTFTFSEIPIGFDEEAYTILEYFLNFIKENEV